MNTARPIGQFTFTGAIKRFVLPRLNDPIPAEFVEIDNQRVAATVCDVSGFGTVVKGTGMAAAHAGARGRGAEAQGEDGYLCKERVRKKGRRVLIKCERKCEKISKYYVRKLGEKVRYRKMGETSFAWSKRQYVILPLILFYS